ARDRHPKAETAKPARGAAGRRDESPAGRRAARPEPAAAGGATRIIWLVALRAWSYGPLSASQRLTSWIERMAAKENVNPDG
ncbi:hypothetical protein, partial [Mesorhizobium sp. M7A.F.Ca.US.010.02.1.1]|uniref:hypothetical protein n=1 Tax=Mesorhizobium sp. M7A.F.Ca.US.010.02.1.1 TaxID=2496743 RepID=UPI0019D48287